MSDKEFLMWLADRIEKIYGEPHNMDFLQRLRRLAERLGR